MRNKLVVISLDSMGFRDLDEWIDDASHLKAIRDHGSWVKRVKGISLR